MKLNAKKNKIKEVVLRFVHRILLHFNTDIMRKWFNYTNYWFLIMSIKVVIITLLLIAIINQFKLIICKNIQLFNLIGIQNEVN